MAAIESPLKSVTTYNTIANTCMECKTCWMPFSKNKYQHPTGSGQDTYQAWLILAQINGLSDLKTRFALSSDNVLSPMRLPEQRLAFIPVFTRLWIHTTRHRKQRGTHANTSPPPACSTLIFKHRANNTRREAAHECDSNDVSCLSRASIKQCDSDQRGEKRTRWQVTGATGLTEVETQ